MMRISSFLASLARPSFRPVGNWNNLQQRNVHNFEVKKVEGDSRERDVCSSCGFINYKNPKVVVGTLAYTKTKEGFEILMCKRGIFPRKGFWTLPAGFMELKESPEQGAAREAKEETLAEVEIENLLAVYSVPKISEVYLWYRAKLLNPADVGIGEESLEVSLVDPTKLCEADIAFPSVKFVIDHFLADSTGTAIDVQTVTKMAVEPGQDAS